LAVKRRNQLCAESGAAIEEFRTDDLKPQPWQIHFRAVRDARKAIDYSIATADAATLYNKTHI
jgi:hypothetical protein